MRRKETKDTEVYQQLRRWILDGNIRPGERLIEQDLCDRFALTRTPLRAALARLCQDHLLVNEPYRGCVLRQLDENELGEAFDLREVLEGLAARIVSEHALDEQLEALAGLALEADRSAQEQDWATYFKLDNTFHSSLIKASGNSQLIDLLEIKHFQIGTAILPVQLSLAHSLNQNARARNHRPVMEAIISRDPVMAEVSARDHIIQAKTLVLNAIISRAEESR